MTAEKVASVDDKEVLLVPSNKTAALTPFDHILNNFVGLMGCGLLVLPVAFRDLGVPTSTFIVALVALASYVSFVIVNSAAKKSGLADYSVMSMKFNSTIVKRLVQVAVLVGLTCAITCYIFVASCALNSFVKSISGSSVPTPTPVDPTKDSEASKWADVLERLPYSIVTGLIVFALCIPRSFEKLKFASSTCFAAFMLMIGTTIYNSFSLRNALEDKSALLEILYQRVGKERAPFFRYDDSPSSSTYFILLMTVINTSCGLLMNHPSIPPLYDELQDDKKKNSNKYILISVAAATFLFIGFPLIINYTIGNSLPSRTGTLLPEVMVAMWNAINMSSGAKPLIYMNLVFGIALILKAPLLVLPLRCMFVDMLKLGPSLKEISTAKNVVLSLCLCIVTTIVAAVVADLGFASSAMGSIGGAVTMFIAPFEFIKICGFTDKRRVLFTIVMLTFMIVSGIVGNIALFYKEKKDNEMKAAASVHAEEQYALEQVAKVLKA